MLPKGRQKRIYIEGAQYFVTFNTHGRLEYFKEPIFCEVFMACLRSAKNFYKFELYAFAVLFDHAHLLFLPHQAKDLSLIMKYLKRHITRNVNYILGYSTETAIGQSPFRLGDKYIRYKDEIEEINKFLKKLKVDFISKYGDNQNVFPKFQWQKSFYDHYIRDQKDFEEHIRYIYENPIKHQLPDPINNKYIFTNYPDLISGY